MNITILIIFLCIVILALAALAFWYRRKWKTAESEKWQTISVMTTLEKEKDAEIEYFKYSLEGEQRLGAEREEEIFRLSTWHNIMQDKLSATLCPTNNHVWKNGVCVKCGRVKDA